MTLDTRDLKGALTALGITSGDTVYVLSALWMLRDFGDPTSLCSDLLAEIQSVIGQEGTLVVQTSSMNLCNTDVPFDPATTPGFNNGEFSEFVRKLPGARRSFHPFNSYTAIGARAEAITEMVSRHAFGPETPEARMISVGAKQLNIGLPPNINTTVCHIEQLMGVPYRYTKEFLHPVVISGESRREPFYFFVRRTDVDAERNHCKRLFQAIGEGLQVQSTKFGRCNLYCYSMVDFEKAATRAFADDIYIWCATPPTQRPFRT